MGLWHLTWESVKRGSVEKRYTFQDRKHVCRREHRRRARASDGTGGPAVRPRVASWGRCGLALAAATHHVDGRTHRRRDRVRPAGYRRPSPLPIRRSGRIVGYTRPLAGIFRFHPPFDLPGQHRQGYGSVFQDAVVERANIKCVPQLLLGQRPQAPDLQVAEHV